LVVGDKELEADSVAVRARKGQDLGIMSIDAFVELIEKDIANRGRIDADAAE
jgi:threonyl-tRNA synthetase